MILLYYFYLFLIIICYIIIEIVRNPYMALIPYNSLITYLHPKKVFYTSEEKREIFPESKILEYNWKNIRDEAIKINNDRTGNDRNVWESFTSENDTFWKGWSSIGLRMYGKNNQDNLDKCPLTKKLLEENPNIITAFFSVIAPHKTLPSHYGPFKGVLRYHLGLSIPPKEEGNCFISVDTQVYEWKNGEGILFDESYKHFVKNETNYNRIILFIDVKRPLHTAFMTLINDGIVWIIKNSPYNN